MKTITRLSYEDLIATLERNPVDPFDSQLLGCLEAVGARTFETYVNRAGAIAAQIRRTMDHHAGHEIFEVCANDCDQILLQYCLLAEGLDERQIFNHVTFTRR